MELGEPRLKKFKHSILSGHLYEMELQEIFYKHWHYRIPIRTSNLEVIAEPFRVCRIFNFLKEEAFMDEIKNELLDVKSRRNSIDLYQFEQSNDLAKVDSDNLKKLYETFQTDLVSWVEKNTKVKLRKTISMSSSCYSDTDYLLCHDDNLGDRRIAFILYLSKNWVEEDGGALDLFNTDDNGLPKNVIRSLIPEYNSLVFFEVSNNSFHQVAEITSPEKSRWSINGWFHGPLPQIEKQARPSSIINYIETENVEVDLNLWISKVYLYSGIMKEIQEDVEQESFAFLSNFLKPEVYEKLNEEIQSDSIKWKKVGPADIRNYEIAEEDSLSDFFGQFYKIFRSISMFQLLKNYTELDLLSESEHMNPKMTIELQRWSRGCYTLISDKHNYDEHVCSSTYEKRSADSRSPFDIVEADNSTSKVIRLQNRYIEDPNLDDKKTSDETGCNTPPSSQGENDYDEEELIKQPSKDTSPRTKRRFSDVIHQQASPSKIEIANSQRNHRNSDTDDSDVSDIGDYLSDPLDCSVDCSERGDDVAEDEVEGEIENEIENGIPGSLDVILQFHTNQVSEEITIDYVDHRLEQAALIHVPSKDNHLCLVYKTAGICRVHNSARKTSSDWHLSESTKEFR